MTTKNKNSAYDFYKFLLTLNVQFTFTKMAFCSYRGINIEKAQTQLICVK